MTQRIQDVLTPTCELLALGEPTHQEAAFPMVRNELFAQLVDLGFRSIALETDRVSAVAVDNYVRHGVGRLDDLTRSGFTHGFGAIDANRGLVAWMRDHNKDLPPADRLSFHGWDIPTENFTAPSPRPYLAHVRDYLGLDIDIPGDDDPWTRTEAVMNHAESPGATPEADRLREIGGALLTALDAGTPDQTATARWVEARTHLTAGLGLLRYHRQCAQPIDDQDTRVARLMATRDALMARNLLDIHTLEARRGPTLVHAHNLHLRRNPGTYGNHPFVGAGAIVAALLGDRYAFIPGSLGRGATLGLAEPAPNTYESHLQPRVDTWGLTTPDLPASAQTRTDTTPRMGYFPLEPATFDPADAILHISDTGAV
ncbi:erythromycin esterase family protein [Actinokineospora auranticolor]|uniref:Erythromycin esterase-like protein n=1 Tax=Actinokineospora auranticolor TaxID=155976 RepID=A0A2S6H0M0_9PSEU|nr:erythromycin esterase family protein [Actinokineospora auranticolor]PPK70950.1 erythromycin esterase-like protein [Actinokineospora auranticolor]